MSDLIKLINNSKLSNNQKFVFILNAPPACGKDVAVDYLLDQYKGRSEKQQFKDVLYQETAKTWGVDYDDFVSKATNRDQKEVKQYQLMTVEGKPLNFSPREMLIITSEMQIKPLKGKQHFGECVAKSIEDSDKPYHFISDGGFIEEIKPLVDKGFKVSILKIVRPNHDFSGDSRRYIEKDEALSIGCGFYAQITNDASLGEYLTRVSKYIKLAILSCVVGSKDVDAE